MPFLARPELLLTAALLLVIISTFAAVTLCMRERRTARARREERRLAAIGAAAARILHQVKNPLQTIILHADLLREPTIVVDPTARAEVSGAIAGEAERLATMLEELSAYASGSTRVLERRPLALHEMVRELAGHEARAGQMVVEASRVEECVVAADPYYLRQALENLISNARDAMHGRPDARLTLEVQRRGGSAVVGVIDTGPGIPPERAKTIFDPFVTGKSKGMGLGLTIAREIVEEHGGRIELVPRGAGTGCHFRVTLPLGEGGGAGA